MKLSRIYLGLLFDQGYLTDPKLVRELAGADIAASEPPVPGASSPPALERPETPRRRGRPMLRNALSSLFR